MLTDATVEQLLPMARAIELNAQAFMNLSMGAAVVPERLHIPFPHVASAGATLVKAASVPALGALGIKVLTMSLSCLCADVNSCLPLL